MAFSYGVQGYGVPQEEPPPPNPFLGGGWDDNQAPPMLPQGEPFRSSGVSPDAADPFATTASAGSYAPAPQYDWSPTGPISYAPDPGTGMTSAAPPADPLAQVPQTAFDRVFGGGQVGGEPFSAPVDRPGPKGAAIDGATGLSEALRLNREQGQTDINQAQMGADLMKRKSDFETNAQIEQEQYRAKYQASIEMAKQVSDKKIEAYKNLKPDTLFGSSRGGERESTIALMILGGINDIMGNSKGQMSSAMQALQIGMKQLETDDSIRFGKALNEAKGAQRDMQTLEAQRDVGLAEIAHRNAARWKVVEDGVKAELAQMAPGEARVKAEQNALTIQQKSAVESQRAQMAAVDLAEKGMKLELAQRKLRGGGGARPGAPGTGDGSDGGPMDIRTVLNAKGEPIGMAPGSAKVSTEGVKARAMYAQLDPIREGLDRMREKISATGVIDRFSGGLTDDMQKIKNLSESLVQPITTATGGGAAQREEAERQLGQVAVGLTRNKDVALAGLDNLLRYVENTYDAKVRSLVPSSTTEQRSGGRAAASAQSPAPLTPQDQAAVEWAQSHRSDQRAAAILRHNGM